MPPPGSSNKRLLWVIPAGCLGMTFCCGGLFVVIAGVVFGAIKSSDVYTEAVKRATEDAQVKQVLGEPVEPGYLPRGDIKINNDSGSANLIIPLSGPRGSATLYAEATKTAGRWNYSRLEVVPATGGPGIDLRPRLEADPGK